MKSLSIIGYFHLFPGEHNAGSETTVHAALRAMVRRGHKVKVICDRSVTAPYDIDGIKVVRPPRRGVQSWLQNFVKDCDLLVTHLDLTSQAMGLANDINKPLVHFIHNSAQLDYWHVKQKAFGGGPDWGPSCRLVVFNSKWIEEFYRWPGKYVTVHPVVEPQYYRCERGTKITLVNPTPGKGAATFSAVAQLMPDREFLAVEGGYGEQIITGPGTRTQATGNIEWMAHTPDIREVFRKTKVLLMPSEYESYGRVGVEAACAGIPTIAHPTPGLTEAFGDAGIFIHRDDVEAWQKEIHRLLTDEIYYRKRSDAVLALANSLTPEYEFDRLELAFVETVEEWMFKERLINEKVLLSNRRLGKTTDGRLTDNMNEAVSLVCGGAGQAIPSEFTQQAQEKGFVDTPAAQSEVLLDTSTLDPGHGVPEAKAIEEPQENKAIEAPEEKKTRKRKKVA